MIALGGIYNNRNWAWALASIIFAVNLINLAYIYFKTVRLFLFTGVILVNIIGFITSITNIKPKEEEEYHNEGKVKKGVDKEEVVVEEIKPLKEGKTLKSYKPEKPEKKKAGKKKTKKERIKKSKK
jgi:hypothetical protein